MTDPAAMLRELAADAREALRQLADGYALNGTSALRRIEAKANGYARDLDEPPTTPRHEPQPVGACAPWWPGRTDEVRRVADRLARMGQPDGRTTMGELAGRTGSSVAIVSDAVDLNDQCAEALEVFAEALAS